MPSHCLHFFIGLFLPHDSLASSSCQFFFKKVVSNLTADEVGRIVMGDSLILKFGERAFEKRDCMEHTYGNINTEMRLLGQLNQKQREKTAMQVSKLEDAIDPAHFDVVVESVKELGELSNSVSTLFSLSVENPSAEGWYSEPDP